MTDTKDLLIREFYKTALKLGAKSELLSILGSAGDTMSYEWTLENLRIWNELGCIGGTVIAQVEEDDG